MSEKIKITRNAFKCKKCGMVVESKFRHDFQKCKCGNFTDGGLDYVRRGGKLEDMEDMSEPRMYFRKGQNERENYEEPKGSALDLMILTLTNFIENEPDEDKVDLEECKQMLEKLKAWKRLKGYNLKFNLDFVKNKIDFTYSINNSLLDVVDGEAQIFNNMKIVFGGEE